MKPFRCYCVHLRHVGNLSYIVPTENQNDILDFSVLSQKIEPLCPELEFITKSNTHIHIVTKKSNTLVCDIMLDQQGCEHLFKPTRQDVINFLEKEGSSEEVKGIREFLALSMSEMPCLRVSYGHDETRRREKVLRIIHQIGRCYWFDEGIHPHYMYPDYKFKHPVLSMFLESLMWNKFRYLSWPKRMLVGIAFYLALALAFIPAMLYYLLKKKKC